MGIIARKVNIKRMHSTLGRGNRILKMGKQHAPMIVPVHISSDSDASGYDSSSDDDESSESSKSQKKTKGKAKRRQTKNS